MFGGPPTPDTSERTQDRDPVGDYKLVHDLAVVGERLFANPGQIVELDIPCPALGDARLVGRANKYTRSIAVWCPSCTFRINR